MAPGRQSKGIVRETELVYVAEESSILMQGIERIRNQVLDKEVVVSNSRDNRREECSDIRGRATREGRKVIGGCPVQISAVDNA